MTINVEAIKNTVSDGVIQTHYTEWHGEPRCLRKGETVAMPQTFNGKMVLFTYNLNKGSDEATVSLSSGGAYYKELGLPAGLEAPHVTIHDWKANNLNVGNISENDSSEVYIAMVGPGFYHPTSMAANGEQYPLAPYRAKQFTTPAQRVRATVGSDSSYAVFTVFIGSEPQVYCVNAPDPKLTPVEGYSDVTTDNRYHMTQNFLGQRFYIVNSSPNSSTDGFVSVQKV